MCDFVEKIAPEVLSGFIATIFAAAVAALYVAHIKVERLRLEFCELSEILKSIHDGRSDDEGYKITEEKFDALKMQIAEIVGELAAAREGVFSAPIAIKKKLCDLEKGIKEEIFTKQEAADFVRKLYGDSVVEVEFRQKILDLSNRSKKLGEELSCYPFLFPS